MAIAAVFGVFFLIAAGLLGSGRVTASAVCTGVLCPWEVVSFSGWYKHGALAWTYDTIFILASLAGLIAAVVALAGSTRRSARA